MRGRSIPKNMVSRLQAAGSDACLRMILITNWFVNIRKGYQGILKKTENNSKKYKEDINAR